jgi:hypothetical protein
VNAGAHIQALAILLQDHMKLFIGMNGNTRASMESVLFNKISAENRTLFAKQFSHNSILYGSEFGVQLSEVIFFLWTWSIVLMLIEYYVQKPTALLSYDKG